MSCSSHGSCCFRFDSSFHSTLNHRFRNINVRVLRQIVNRTIERLTHLRHLIMSAESIADTSRTKDDTSKSNHPIKFTHVCFSSLFLIWPDIDKVSADLTLPEEVYAQALMNKPAIKAAQYRLQGAEKSIKIAQSAYYPQLSFGAGIGTNYYRISGVENASFGSQWDQNMNKYLQFSLSVPIFNRFQTRNRVKSARIQRIALSWQLEESKKALYKEIQQAYYNALAAESKYKSSQSASESAEASFKLMSEKYANGKASATEYNEMRTAWMKALSDGIQAKYEFPYIRSIRIRHY